MDKEQTKNNEDCLKLFQQLPRLNHRYEVKEKGVFIPTLYVLNKKWYISLLNFDDGSILEIFRANTIEEVVKQATKVIKQKYKQYKK